MIGPLKVIRNFLRHGNIDCRCYFGDHEKRINKLFELCKWQTQPFYGKGKHCRSRKKISTIVPTKIQEVFFFQDFGRVQGNIFINPKVRICKISFLLREKNFYNFFLRQRQTL